MKINKLLPLVSIGVLIFSLYNGIMADRKHDLFVQMKAIASSDNIDFICDHLDEVEMLLEEAIDTLDTGRSILPKVTQKIRECKNR